MYKEKALLSGGHLSVLISCNVKVRTKEKLLLKLFDMYQFILKIV